MHENNYNTPKLIPDENTVKPVLSGRSKKTKKKILKTNDCLMQVKSIAECSREHSAIFSTYIKLKSVFKTYVSSFFEWPHKTGFTVSQKFFRSYS